MSDTEKVFTEIYDTGKWVAAGESRSGTGSTMRATELVRPALHALFQEYAIRTLCDAPCGDGIWISTITDCLDIYMGFDIVPALLEENTKREPRINHFYRYADVTNVVLPKADAILCRDCLVHLPLDMAIQALDNFRASGSTYLLTTTFLNIRQNREIPMGRWRQLNMQTTPFNFPRPLALIRERQRNSQDKYNDKMLGLWKLSDIRPFSYKPLPISTATGSSTSGQVDTNSSPDL